MATLRSLLTGAGGGGTISNIGHTSLVHRQKPGKELLFLGMCGNAQDQNYCRNIMCNWKVPPDTSCITFEIWGGGGGGAGSCCCAWGIPGGSGAWAKKTITGDLGGCDYVMYAGFQACCSPVMACGYRGCQSYVTGFGLSNFCAEGGFSGRTQCFTFWGNFNCAGNNNGNVRLCYTETDCRCYYGADEGSPGRPGYLWAQCSCNPCNWKYIVPFPGGLVNKGGGFTATRVQGNACNQEWLKCIPSIGYSLDTNYNFLPGRGGMSATSCGGGCCYGFSGNPGFARITYS